jgi:mannose-6-phosphate isomerase-like protein (cupin superfamily)
MSVTAVKKVNLAEAFRCFGDAWIPRVAGEVNGTQIKLVRLRGEFFWYRHDTEDELFLVVSGKLLMRFREKDISVGPGEFLIVPHGVEHMPVAEEECEVMLLESRTLSDAGSVEDERTLRDLERID